MFTILRGLLGFQLVFGFQASAHAGVCSFILKSMAQVLQRPSPVRPANLAEQIEFFKLMGLSQAELNYYFHHKPQMNLEDRRNISRFFHSYRVTGETSNLPVGELNALITKVILHLDQFTSPSEINPYFVDEKSSTPIDLSLPVTEIQKARAAKLGLTLVTHGRITKSIGVHSSLPVAGSPLMSSGSYVFVDDGGEEWLAMKPVDDTSFENIMQFFKDLSVTPAKGFIYEPAGLTYVHGVPFLLFPQARGTNASWSELSPENKDYLKSILNEKFYSLLEMADRPFGSRQFSTENLFISSSGKIRMSLPVRSGITINAFYQDQLFRR